MGKITTWHDPDDAWCSWSLPVTHPQREQLLLLGYEHGFDQWITRTTERFQIVLVRFAACDWDRLRKSLRDGRAELHLERLIVPPQATGTPVVTADLHWPTISQMASPAVIAAWQQQYGGNGADIAAIYTAAATARAKRGIVLAEGGIVYLRLCSYADLRRLYSVGYHQHIFIRHAALSPQRAALHAL